MNERILILRLSSMGDILLSTPFIRQVRISFPKADIDFVIKKQFHDLIKSNPHINKIYLVQPEKGIRGLKELRKQLKKRKYTHILDLHNNMRTRFLTFFLKSIYKNRIKKNKIKRFLLVRFKINLYKNITPITERYLKIAEAVNVHSDGYGLEIFWRDFYEHKIDKLFQDFNLQGKFIVIAPGATAYTKRWPLSYFSLLIKDLIRQGEKIILLGGEEDRPGFEELVKSKRVINLAGETSILDTALIIDRAKAMISNDSGLMHMATAVRTPVLAIFGSTVQELGFFPYHSASIVVENKELQCRPCSHVGRKKCPKKHFKCMKEILPEMVLERFGELL